MWCKSLPLTYTDVLFSGFYCTGWSSEPAPVGKAYGDVCTAGSYCPNGTAIPVPCMAGTFSQQTGLKMQDDCTKCSPGNLYRQMLQITLYYCQILISSQINPYMIKLIFSGIYYISSCSILSDWLLCYPSALFGNKVWFEYHIYTWLDTSIDNNKTWNIEVW